MQLVNDEVCTQLRNQGFTQVLAQVKDSDWYQVYDQVWGRIRNIGGK